LQLAAARGQPGAMIERYYMISGQPLWRLIDPVNGASPCRNGPGLAAIPIPT